MEINPIRTEADYKSALKEIESLMAARAGSLEGKRLISLVSLVESCEAIHFPVVEIVVDSASRPNH